MLRFKQAPTTARQEVFENEEMSIEKRNIQFIQEMEKMGVSLG